ncbi:L-aminoadipate-semialdehyde dehydrogenase-phosphopantetheinyl transferase isoform X2 [Rissa tridactyla]|uniref:L-aminoadipate-semialdehyde dehydrogenase-phosphopantetheinyl transferase isoform X2 n=1 Tax=Rissa tridactyla TaxID=75485 RepID=UPI0023BA5FB5|nr:L-aminoadipate-semialdehyde dehydrogenase-phosphopantetheinyl transferase isoform X2 [Rissa tridactyla]
MGSVRWAFPCAAWRPCREEWLLAARLVQPEEKDRIGQFVFARDAKAALAGRLLIRKLIAEKLRIPWNEITLQRTSKGKPFLANNIFGIYSNYNFNVSHQGDYAVLAAEPELQVGIDIMKTNLPGSSSIPNFFRIMNRQFTETEWGVISSMGNEWMQLDMFHRYWALKESFLKAIGVGIGFNLQRIEFNVSPLQLEIGKVYKETKMLLDGDKEEEWTFENTSQKFTIYLIGKQIAKETRLDDHHHVAVALGKQEGFGQKHSDVSSVDPDQPQFTLLTFEDLVASGIPVAPEDSAYWDNFCSKQESPVKQNSHSR